MDINGLDEYEVYEELKKKERKKRFIALFLISLYIGFMFLVISGLSQTKYINKISIHSDLSKAINNDAKLNIIKNIYFNREIVSINGIEQIFANLTRYYTSDIPLSQILYNIQSEYYIKKNNSDVNITKLSEIIKTYSVINPFDSLKDSQKDNFNNIIIKLNTNYKLVKNDVEKIAKELIQKNELVDKYLNDSTKSFLISIFALVFTAILGIYQLYLGREERQKKIISDALKNIHKMPSKTQERV